MAARSADDWPLIGRDELVDQAWAALRAEPARAVVLSGEAGIGKSRMAAALSEQAGDADWVVRRTTASASASTIPFGALATLLPTVSGGDALALLQDAQASLAALAGGAPLLLWVDDAHLLDPGSATLVAQLADAGTARLVITVRSGEAVPDVLEQLWRSDRGERFDLGALDLAATGALLDVALGPPVAAGTAHRLWQRSGGNPLMLRELVRASLVTGALSDDSGAWLLDDSEVESPALADLVSRRIGALDPASQQAVELLALADVLSTQLLQSLAPDADLLALEERGLLDVDQDGRRVEVRLSHPLYGEVTRQSLATLRRRRDHGRLIDAVTGTGARRREDTLRIAAWSLDSDHSPGPDLLADAARQALARFDLALGERLARAAVDAGGGIRAQVTLGDITWRRGRVDDALAILGDAAATAVAEDEIAEVANSRSYVLELAGRPSEAWQVLLDAGERVGPEQHDLLDSQAAILSVLAGRPRETLEAVSRVLSAHDHRTSLDLLVRIRVDYAEAFALAMLGRFDEATQAATAAADFIGSHPEAQMPPELALLGRVLSRVWGGWLDDAESDAVRVEQAALALGDRDAEWTTALYRGRVALARGELATALTHFERGAAIARELGDPAGLRWTIGGQTICLSMLGRSQDCAEAAAELDSQPSAAGGLFETDLVSRGRAWAQVSAGRFDDARQTLREAASAASDLGQPAVEVTVRHDLLRLGDEGQAEALASLAEQCVGPWPRAAAAHADARRSADGARLVAAATQLADCGALLEAAECATAAAEAHRRAGRPRDATAAMRAAAAWLAASPGARTPALARASDATPLTRREREIAVLAAQQISATDIAKQLHLSRRTVENHLQRIYTKLGISSRAALAEALNR